MTLSRGGVRLSVEPLESRDVPSRLSTALANISSQQFNTPNSAGYGALNYAYGPARYDTVNGNTVAAFLTDTYFSGIAGIALIQEKATDAEAVVGKWINWNLRNISGDGSFLRRFYYADGSVPTTAPTLPPDADDSSASLFFITSNDYAEAGYNTSILTASGVKQVYEAVGTKLLSLQQTDGLTLGSTSYPVKFLMDNCESYAGFLAMAQLELAVWNDPTQAAVYSTAAAKAKQGVLTTLYDSATGLFKWTSDAVNDISKFYPAYGVTFPALYGVLDMTVPAELAIAQFQVQALNNYWSGGAHPNWRTGAVDPASTQNFFASPLAYATLLSGNVSDGTTFSTTMFDAYYPNGATTPQYNQRLTIADNAWLAMALGAIDGNPAVGSTLTVNGTSAADSFVLSPTPTRSTGNVTLSFNGGIPQAYTGITAVSVNGQNGNDLLTVYAAKDVALVAGNVTYNGGAGTNTLTVQAQGQPVHATGSAVGIWEFFTTQFTNTQKVNTNGAFMVNALAGPDTAARSAIPSGQTANDRWVQRLYLDVLARPASAADRTYWLNQLAGGSTRAAVTAGITNSVEARTLLVRKWYALYLGRTAVGGEEGYWVNLIGAIGSEEQVLGYIISSQEFYNRAGGLFATGTADEKYVKAMYRFTLHRVPSAGEVSYWVGQMAATSRLGVAVRFLTSTEYRNYECSGVYAAYLQRPADATGVNSYQSSGSGIADLRRLVLGSAEYFQL